MVFVILHTSILLVIQVQIPFATLQYRKRLIMIYYHSFRVICLCVSKELNIISVSISVPCLQKKIPMNIGRLVWLTLPTLNSNSRDTC